MYIVTFMLIAIVHIPLHSSAAKQGELVVLPTISSPSSSQLHLETQFQVTARLKLLLVIEKRKKESKKMHGVWSSIISSQTKQSTEREEKKTKRKGKITKQKWEKKEGNEQRGGKHGTCTS